MDLEHSARFSLRGVIGRGGMGIVYAAYDRERATEVALKTITQLSPDAIFRFKREFRALADVTHPNLVSLYELSSEAGQWFFTMELLAGVDILHYLRTGSVVPRPTQPAEQLPNSPTMTAVTTASAPESPSMTPEGIQWPLADEGRIREAFPQLVDGVAALHASGHLHRDIKPSNIMVTADKRIVLLDFGVTTELRQLGKAGDDRFAGTPAYMAPEQLAPSSAIPRASDWYSVGVILYEALAGRRPFHGNGQQILAAKRERTPTHPRDVHPDAPADLCEICMRMLDRDPRNRPSADQITAVLRGLDIPDIATRITDASTLAQHFVGREEELTTIRDAYAAAGQGTGSVLYVAGKSGMGKSLLIRHFLDKVSEDPTAVLLEGRCYQRESVPYKAVDSVVDALSLLLLSLPPAEVEQLLPPDAHMLARIFPVLERIDALVAQSEHAHVAPDPHELKMRAFRALREILRRLSNSRPVVLFIDDLQWGDVDSAPLLDGLMRPPEQPSLLLLASFRSEERERSPLLRSLFRRQQRQGPGSTTKELIINALDHEQSVKLATVLAGRDSNTIDTERLARESDGHPYFIHELVSQARNDPSVTGDALTLDEAISRRVAALPQHARLTLELIAVAGHPIPQRVIQEAGQLPAAVLKQTVRILQAGRFVHTSGTRSEDLVETFHDRIRETVGDSLDEQVLRQHHRALADALLSADADIEALLAHYRAAGDDEAAGAYAIRAADQAAEALAFGQAANLYAYAIEVLERNVSIDIQALRIKLAEALANAGQGPKAAAAYFAAVPGATSTDALDLQRCAALQYLRGGHIDEGLDAIGVVLGRIGLHLPQTPRRSLVSLLWYRARLRLRGLGFRPRDVAEISEEDLCRIDTCWSVSLGLSMVDTYRCADYQTRGLIFALRSGERYRISRALAMEIAIASMEGTKVRARALEIIREAQRLAEELGEPEVHGWVEATVSLADFQVGLFRSSLEHAELALPFWRDQCTGLWWEVTAAELYRLWSLFYLGEFKRMRGLVDTLLEEALTRGDLYTAASLCCGLPNLALMMAGRVDEARSLLDDVLKKWSRKGFHLQHYWAHVAYAHHELYAGDAEGAYARMNQLVRDLNRSMILRIQSVRCEALHMRARCALAIAAADPERKDCIGQATRDAKRLARDRTDYSEALALLLRAGICAVREGVEHAVPLHEAAEAAALKAELGFHVMAIRRRRGSYLGGDIGTKLVSEADKWLTRQGVVDPAGIVDIFVPA